METKHDGSRAIIDEALRSMGRLRWGPRWHLRPATSRSAAPGLASRGRGCARSVRTGSNARPHGGTAHRAARTVLVGHARLVDDQLGKSVAHSRAMFDRPARMGCRDGPKAYTVDVVSQVARCCEANP